MKLPGKIAFVFLAGTALLMSGCGGSSISTSGGTSGGGGTTTTANEWTWMSGSNTADTSGVYGTKGTASTSNVPGARSGSVSWTDSNDNLWLFGGWGNDSTGANGVLNDLWKFNPTTKEWTWVSGSNTIGATGVYGTQGTASSSNIPGARSSAVSWIDNGGNFWLFGGNGNDSNVPTGGALADGVLNDLWEFSLSTKEWTWVSGSNTTGAKGVYGTQGIASASNTPGARGNDSEGPAYSWVDTSGNLWLFGGSGEYSDVWEFSPSTKEWTWVSGSSSENVAPVYGTQGVESTSNTPGARALSVSWSDKNGNFWIYGGEPSADTCGNDFSDLWEFNITTKEWTWVNGSDCGSVVAVYGTQGTASAGNTPGGLDSAVSWTDSSGNLWLFGGFNYIGSGANGTNEYQNALWEFNITTKEWTWMGGSNTGNAKGVYGTLGTASATNVPGARGSEGVAVTWIDSSGNFWLLGGVGFDSTGAWGVLNDLWRYQP